MDFLSAFGGPETDGLTLPAEIDSIRFLNLL